jgi:hypothetical protein
MIAEENVQREEVVHERAKIDLRDPVELERPLVRSAVDSLGVASGHGEHVLEDRGLVEHAPTLKSVFSTYRCMWVSRWLNVQIYAHLNDQVLTVEERITRRPRWCRRCVLGPVCRTHSCDLGFLLHLGYRRLIPVREDASSKLAQASDASVGKSQHAVT